MTDLWHNPLGTDGFEFVEFTSPDPAALKALFEQLGFRLAGRHRSKDVLHYRQGDINLILNGERAGQPAAFKRRYGPSANAMGLRVRDAVAAFERAITQGAEPVEPPVGHMELKIPAIRGVGGAMIYLVDRYGSQTIYDVDFKPVEQPGDFTGVGLTGIDHLTHNLYRGSMDRWADFYEHIFNFREVRFFDIEGKLTGLVSRAMTSPCGKIRIPLNESTDDKSQIVEFLKDYGGEGIQHIALSTDDIHATVENLRATGVPFQDTPESYYDGIDERLPGHGEDLMRLRKNRVLIDGAPQDGEGLLLQIFTQTAIGPIFFEIIQRKGNEGFGEGNFQALFESIERDQIERGVLKS
ncbi:MAG: 4-hydroxyphenylpyruvate dioxygenase [Pseudomonadota bacterium]